MPSVDHHEIRFASPLANHQDHHRSWTRVEIQELLDSGSQEAKENYHPCNYYVHKEPGENYPALHCCDRQLVHLQRAKHNSLRANM